MTSIRAIGIMTGTSVDGIDTAILETDGERILAVGPALAKPFDTDLRLLLKDLLLHSRTLKPGFKLTDKMRIAERHLTIAAATVVNELLTAAHLTKDDIDVIGFHGQTLVHKPIDPAKPASQQNPFTCQLGNGELLAQLTGCDVVYDFRSADVAAGGQGAPFAPIFHKALANWSKLNGPAAVINIGGVANITYLPETDNTDITAFDTGPGNGLIDDWMTIHTGQKLDKDGATAAMGRIHEDVLTAMMDHPYFATNPPKSLDRYDFDLAPVQGLSVADGAATLTAFTARTIATAADHLPAVPKTWIVCGGGRHNKELMRQLTKEVQNLGPVSVTTADDVGWDGDLIEAQAFAFLAVRSLRDLPLSFPKTTGVPLPTRGGTHVPAPQAVEVGS